MSKIKEKCLLYHAIMSEFDDRDIYFFTDGHWSFTAYEYPAVKDATHNIITPGTTDPRAEFEISCANRVELEMALDKMDPPPEEFETEYEKLQAALAVFAESSRHVVKPALTGNALLGYNRTFNDLRFELKGMLDELDIWLGGA